MSLLEKVALVLYRTALVISPLVATAVFCLAVVAFSVVLAIGGVMLVSMF
jgi:hypothetical protein